MARETRAERGREKEDEEPRRGRGGRDEERDTRGGGGGAVSLDDEDAIDSGLFASGDAEVTESLFTPYDYQGTTRGAKPIVWLVTYVRGSGKDKEQYEQPYGIGKGWDVDKKGNLIAKNGQKGLPKNCNAMLYLVTPLKEACRKAKIDPPPFGDGDPEILVGLKGSVERVNQEERDIRQERGGGRDRDRDRGGDRDRGRGRERDEERDTKGSRTILVIDSVDEAPWEKGGGKGRGKEETSSRDRGRGKAEEPEPEETAGPDEDAVEAIIAVVEEGPVKFGDELEEALEKHLKGKKGSGAIIDVASSKKFLQQEKGWTFDGKVVGPEEKKRGRR